MEFHVSEEKHFIRGDTTREVAVESRQMIQRLMGKEVDAYFMQVVTTGDSTSTTQETARDNKDLGQLLARYEAIFQTPTTLPTPRKHNHHIRLGPGSNPVNVRPYRYPHIQKNEIEHAVKEMLATGIIRPSSSSFLSPVLLVKKKDGSWCFFVDYHTLNKATVKDRYSILVIDELLDELHGATYFTKLDLKSDYHQIRVQPIDAHKIDFRTHDGHYGFFVMPFGLTNAPATFQSLMNDIFRTALRMYVLLFFDDILIYSKTWEEHLVL